MPNKVPNIVQTNQTVELLSQTSSCDLKVSVELSLASIGKPFNFEDLQLKHQFRKYTDRSLDKP